MQLFVEDINNNERERENNFIYELNNIDENKFFEQSIDELVEDFYNKYKYLDLPNIMYEQAYLNKEPIIDRNNIKFDINIPIEGQFSSIKYCPFSTRLCCSNFKADINESENALCMQVNLPINPNFEIDDYIETTINNRRKDIDNQYNYLKRDITDYNQRLKKYIDSELRKMESKVQIKRQLVEKSKQSKYLKIVPKFTEPIKIVESKIETSSNKILKQEEKPKSYLLLEKSSYIQIYDSLKELSIYANRLPKSYFKLEEEDIRDQLVNSLNLKLKTATATGETFNVRGKTDIIIIDNKIIYFIAECKIWKGQSKFNDAIDQLMSYISEEVCYSSIIVFNKNKNKIIDQASEIIKKRQDYLSYESMDRYIFKHPKNPNLKLEISLIVFDIYYE